MLAAGIVSGKITDAIAIRTAEERRPELFRRAYPRSLNFPSSFHSPKALAVISVTTLEEALLDFRYHGVYNEVGHHVYFCAARLMEEGVPTYFPSLALVQALLDTDLPDDLTLQDLCWPFGALYFVMPRGAYSNTDGELVGIGIARVPEGQRIRLLPSLRSDSGMGCKRDAVSTIGIFDTGCTYSWLHPLGPDKLNCVNKDKILPALDWKLDTDTQEMYPVERLLTDEDQQDLAASVKLSMLLMLALMARPDLVEPQAICRAAKVKHGQKVCPDLWYPNFMGRTYVSSGVPQGGTHASPRTHRRRGHMRLLRAEEGARWKVTKSIWIEPTWVLRGFGKHAVPVVL